MPCVWKYIIPSFFGSIIAILTMWLNWDSISSIFGKDEEEDEKKKETPVTSGCPFAAMFAKKKADEKK